MVLVVGRHDGRGIEDEVLGVGVKQGWGSLWFRRSNGARRGRVEDVHHDVRSYHRRV